MLFASAKLAIKHRRAVYEGTEEETVIAFVLLSQGGIRSSVHKVYTPIWDKKPQQNEKPDIKTSPLLRGTARRVPSCRGLASGPYVMFRRTDGDVSPVELGAREV